MASLQWIGSRSRIVTWSAIIRKWLASPSAVWVVLLIATVVRLWQLDYHSVWFDEAVSLQWARSDPAFIWQKTFPLVEEKHPPLYFLGLHYWRELLGLVGLANSDAALRLFGSLLGVATVAGILLLAQRISGRVTGLLTGLLVALCPVLVWYSQELRMFQPATTGLVWGAYCLQRAWDAETNRRALGRWLGMVLAFTAALYSYLFSAFLLPAAGFLLLCLLILSTRKERWQRFLCGALALAFTGALFLPLAYNAWIVNSSEGDPGHAFADAGSTLWRLLHIFTLWRVDWPPLLVTVSLLFIATFFLIGLVSPNHPTVLARLHLDGDRRFLGDHGLSHCCVLLLSCSTPRNSPWRGRAREECRPGAR